EPSDPGDQLVLIRVRAEPLERGDLGANARRLTEDVHDLGAFHQSTAEGPLGLESDEEHRVALVAESVLEMVEDAAALTHARGGDDDAGLRAIVETLRFLGRGDVAQTVEAEG